MKLKLRKQILSFLLLLLIFFINFSIAQAQDTSLMGSVRPECNATGDCELNDFIRLAVGISKYILGLVGSLSLLMFVYGGFLIMTQGQTVTESGGKSTTINKGRNVIKTAVVGLVIVFSAYLIIDFVLKSLGYTGTWNIVPQ